jgi:DNA-directed RNA polymerase beta subunit
VQAFNLPHYQDEVFINLYDFVGLKTADDAQDWIAKKIGITQSKDVRLERINEVLDRFLLPHLGITPEARMVKAQNLCKLFRRFMLVVSGVVGSDDKDHYANKRVKMSGDLLADLFRANLRVLIDDLLYNFQRIVKRGKFPSIKVIIRDKLLTSRIYSAMATGAWVGGRKGISQRIQRLNHLDTVSHLQRVVSPLASSQENFEARALHATHLGRLCPIETPEGTNIGLRKNLSLLSEVSLGADDEAVLKVAKNAGLKLI